MLQKWVALLAFCCYGCWCAQRNSGLYEAPGVGLGWLRDIWLEPDYRENQTICTGLAVLHVFSDGCSGLTLSRVSSVGCMGLTLLHVSSVGFR